MRKYFKTVALLMTVVLMASTLCSCATFDAFKSEFIEKDKQTVDTIKIGVFGPFSGVDKKYGELERKGIELANELYPKCLGKDVELIYADNKSDLNAAEEQIQILIEQEPTAILGSYGSAYSLVASKYIKEAKIPTIAATNTNPLVTLGNPYYFSISSSDSYMGTALGKYAVEVLNVNCVAVLAKEKDDSTLPVISGFEDKVIQMTGNNSSVKSVTYKDDLSDVQKKLEALNSEKINVILLPARQEESIKIMTIAEKVNHNFIFLGTDAWNTSAFIESDGKVASMAQFITMYDAGSDVNSTSKEFLEAYRAKYGKNSEPEPEVALAFDSYMIVMDSINKISTSKNTELLRKELSKSGKFSGASGNITFDANGSAMKTVIIKGVQGKSFTTLYTIEPKITVIE